MAGNTSTVQGKRKRGRPRKSPTTLETASTEVAHDSVVKVEEEIVVKVENDTGVPIATYDEYCPKEEESSDVGSPPPKRQRRGKYEDNVDSKTTPSAKPKNVKKKAVTKKKRPAVKVLENPFSVNEKGERTYIGQTNVPDWQVRYWFKDRINSYDGKRYTAPPKSLSLKKWRAILAFRKLDTSRTREEMQDRLREWLAAEDARAAPRKAMDELITDMRRQIGNRDLEWDRDDDSDCSLSNYWVRNPYRGRCY